LQDMEAQLSQQADSAAQALQDMEAQLSQQADSAAQALQDMEAQLSQQADSAAQALQQAQDREAKQGEEIHQLRQQSAEDLAELQQRLTDQEVTTGGLLDRAADLEHQLEMRFQELAALTKLLQRGEARVQELSQERNDLRRRLAAQAEVKDKLQQARAEIGILHEQDQRRQGEIDGLFQQRDHLEREYQMIRDSTSWRITGPLRRIVLFTRGR